MSKVIYRIAKYRDDWCLVGWREGECLDKKEVPCDTIHQYRVGDEWVEPQPKREPDLAGAVESLMLAITAHSRFPSGDVPPIVRYHLDRAHAHLYLGKDSPS